MKHLIAFCFFYSLLAAQEKLLDSTALSKQKIYTSLAEALKEPWKVYKLSLPYQHIDKIPQQIGQFKNLQVLDLSGNGISEVSDQIGELKNLQMLNLSSQVIPSQPNYSDVVPSPCLYKLSPAIGNLTHLTHLHLQGHAMAPLDLFHFVSKYLIGLKKLRVLDLIAHNDDVLGESSFSRFQAMRIQRMLNARVLFDSSVYQNIRMRPIVNMWIDSVTTHDSAEVIKRFLKQDEGVEQSYARLLKIIPDMTPSLQIEFTMLNGNRTPLKVVSKVYDGFTGSMNLYEPTDILKPLIQTIQSSVFKKLPMTLQPVFVRVWYELNAVEE